MVSMHRTRGICERPKGSGTWWVRYCDQHGRLHRERIGPSPSVLHWVGRRPRMLPGGMCVTSRDDASRGGRMGVLASPMLCFARLSPRRTVS